MPKINMTPYTRGKITLDLPDASVQRVHDYVTANPGQLVNEIAWETGVSGAKINQMLYMVPALYNLARSGHVAVLDRGLMPRWYIEAKYPTQVKRKANTAVVTSADTLTQMMPDKVVDGGLRDQWLALAQAIKSNFMRIGGSPRRARLEFDKVMALVNTVSETSQDLLTHSDKVADQYNELQKALQTAYATIELQKEQLQRLMPPAPSTARRSPLGQQPQPQQQRTPEPA